MATKEYSVFLETGCKKEEQSDPSPGLSTGSDASITIWQEGSRQGLPPDEEDRAFALAISEFEAERQKIAMQNEKMEIIAFNSELCLIDELEVGPVLDKDIACEFASIKFPNEEAGQEISLLPASFFDLKIDAPFFADLPPENYGELLLETPVSFTWALYDDAAPESWMTDMANIEYIAWQEKVEPAIAVAPLPVQDTNLDALFLTDLPLENYTELVPETPASFAWALYDDAAPESWMIDMENIEYIAWQERVEPAIAVAPLPVQDADPDALFQTDLPSENYAELVPETPASFAWALYEDAAPESWMIDMANIEYIAWQERVESPIAVAPLPVQDADPDALFQTDLPSENYAELVPETPASFAWALYDDAAPESWMIDMENIEYIAWQERVEPAIAVAPLPVQDTDPDALFQTDLPSENYAELVPETPASFAWALYEDAAPDSWMIDMANIEYIAWQERVEPAIAVAPLAVQDADPDALFQTDLPSENYAELVPETPASFAWALYEDAAPESWMIDMANVEYIAWQEEEESTIAAIPLPVQDADSDAPPLLGMQGEDRGSTDLVWENLQEAKVEMAIANQTVFMNVLAELDHLLAELEIEEFLEEPNIEKEIATAKEDFQTSERAIFLSLLRESEQRAVLPTFIDSSEREVLTVANDFEAGTFEQEPEIPVIHGIMAYEETDEKETVETPSLKESPLAVELPSQTPPSPRIDPPLLAAATKSSSPAATDPEAWDPYFWPKRIVASHVIGHQDERCVPFATNFTTLEILLAPEYRQGHFLPMIDLYGHRFDNTLYAANAGLAGRYIPQSNASFCELLGFNAFYDYRQSCFGYFQQIGVGLEILGRRWDIRGNIYVPFGAKKHGRTCVFDEYSDGYYVIRQDVELVSYSFNAEVGFSAINGKNFLLYMAAGPYFIAGRACANNTPGVEIRLRPQYKDYLYLDLSYRYDQLFRTIWQAKIAVVLPLYQISGKKKRPCGLFDRQIYQSIERFEVLPVDGQTYWQTNY